MTTAHSVPAVSSAAAGPGMGTQQPVTMEVFGDVLVAHTPDELTDETIAGFLHALEAPLAEGRNRVVLHMEYTEAFDSAGLAGLLDLRDLVRTFGGTTKVSGLTEIGRTIFAITRFDQTFQTFPSVLDAVSSFVAMR